MHLKFNPLALCGGLALLSFQELQSAPAAAPQLFRTAPAQNEYFVPETPAWVPTLDSNQPLVSVDETKQFQSIEGFGGAFTESAASVFAEMPAAEQERFIEAYFDVKKGNGYTLGRTHINSCDFSLGSYAYADTPGDTELKSFTIDHDKKQIIPFIKRAVKVAGPQLRFFSSPWSPPAWMKTNNNMLEGGQVKPEYRQAWADYYVRYFEEYAKEGIPFWGLTVQNEPEASQRWESCRYTPEEERDFVRDYLGPTLAKKGMGDKKIIVWDHNRGQMLDRANVIYGDPAAAKYVWGLGFHWYGSDHFDNVRLIAEAWPEKKLIFTEGCQEGGPHLNSLDVGERYGRSIINDLNRGASAWVDWNLLLNEEGGPNHVGNLCSAPIMWDRTAKKLIFNPSYFYLGHISRFIKRDARRVSCGTTSEKLIATAFLNPDGSLAVVVMNTSDRPMNTGIRTRAGNTQITCPPRSIQTLVLPKA